MDVQNLVPSSNPASPRASATGSKGHAAPLAFTAAAGASQVSHRPTAPGSSVGDRLERTPELSKRIEELRQEMQQSTDSRSDKIEQLRSEIHQSNQVTHQTLVRAALGILHGELYFSP